MKSKDVPEGPLQRPIAACRQHLRYAAGLSAVINLLYLAPTIYMLQVYDRVVPSNGTATLGYLTLLLLATLGTLCLLEFIRSRLLVRATLRLERVLTGPLLADMLSARGRAVGAQVMRDFDIFRQTTTGAGALALFDSPWVVVYIVFCFMLHWLVGVLASVGAVTLVVLAIATERLTRRRMEAANEAMALAYASVSQSVAAAETISALGMTPAMVRRHEGERVQVVRLQAEASVAAGRFLSLTKFVRLSLQSLVLGLAAYLALKQELSAGAIFAASLLTARALAPIEQLLVSWKTLTEAHHAYRGLKDRGAAAAADPTRTRLPAPGGHISVEQLTILGAPGRRPLLHGVNLDLEPGVVLGLVGPSGAGKTTLLRVLVGALMPSQGSVRFDGAEISDWSPERLGRHIGYLPQDLGLLPGTVKQNICRFRDSLEEDIEALDDKVIAAAVACGAHEMIVRLPNGYDTELGRAGQGVSLGQAQRIALARAFFDQPNFVALDEPDAHLDSAGQLALVSALKELKARGASVIVAAHGDALLEAMDELLVIFEGRLTQRGPRDAVIGRLRAFSAAAVPAEPQRRYA